MPDDLPVRPLEPAELDPGLLATLGPRVANRAHDDLPVLFRILARQPDAYARMLEMAAAIERDLPDPLIQLLCITAAHEQGDDWVRVTHENLALRMGMAAEWVRDVRRFDPTTERPTSLSDDERTAQRLCLAVLANRPESGAIIREIAHSHGDAYAVALLMLIGYYAMGTVVTRVLGLRSPPSELDGRD